MKKLYVIIFALLLLSPFSRICYADGSATIIEHLGGTTADGLIWRYNDVSRSEIWITGYKEDSLAEVITIPDTMTIWSVIDQKHVTSPVTKVIEGYTFSNCTQIKEVEINASRLTEIPLGTFENCTELTKVILPENLLKIGSCAFDGCTKLNSINLPEGLAEIEHYALRDTALTSITIPKSVTNIGYAAFAGCTSLSNINWNAKDVTVNSTVFNGSITTPGSTVIFGEEVESIPESLFSFCTGITDVTFPESLTSIGVGAFFETGLTSITLPENLTTIGDDAFSGCTSLRQINWNAKNISKGSFNNCAVEQVIFGDKVESLPDDAFHACTKLTDIIIPSQITHIGEGTFRYCYGLKSIIIPENVTSIGEYAFYRCEALTDITIPNSLTTVEDCAFRDCYVLDTVNYNGDQESWDRINIVGYNNNLLKNARRNYFWYVSYLDEDGAYIQRDNVSDNANIDLQIITVEDGYKLRFYTDENLTTEFDISTPVTKNTTLYVVKEPVALTANTEKNSVGYVFNVTLNKKAIKNFENALLIVTLYDGDKFVCMSMLPVTSVDISIPITVETKENVTSAKLLLWDGFDTLMPLCGNTQITIS